MIEKLNIDPTQSVATNHCIINKINELVEFCNDIGNARSFLERHEEQITKLNDAVNELQLAKDVMFNRIDMLNNAICDIRNATENVQDKFAEQRKWIGKLCEFWDYDGEEKWFSILEHIDKNSPYTYCASGDWWYKHCEPVKPDDDIIYKGE